MVGRRRPYNRKEWITEEIVEKIKRRRELNSNSSKGQQQYRDLRNVINRESKAARKRFFEKKCKEKGDLFKSNRMTFVYKTVKVFFGDGRINAVGLRPMKKNLYTNRKR